MSLPECSVSSGPKVEAPAKQQSQFLPGTNIQFAWDSTCLAALKQCPRLYKYLYVDGWAPKDESIHLRFGIEYHQGLHDYEIGRAGGASHDDSLRVAIRDLLVRCGDYPDVDPNGRPSVRVKTKTNLVRSIIWYVDQFKDDPAETVIISKFDPDGNQLEGSDTPAMEVSFKFELDWGPEHTLDNGGVIYDAAGGPMDYVEPGYRKPYLLCGHLDRLVTYADETFVMDRKTATTTLTPHYFAQYEPNNQMTLYTLAGQVVLGTSIRGVIIDAAAIQVGGTWFQRGFTYRTQGQLDEWLRDLKWWLKQAEDYAVADHYPMNDTACSMYGGCRFREICSKDPAVRERYLEAQFTKQPVEKRWNPLTPRG